MKTLIANFFLSVAMVVVSVGQAGGHKLPVWFWVLLVVASFPCVLVNLCKIFEVYPPRVSEEES